MKVFVPNVFIALCYEKYVEYKVENVEKYDKI